MLALHKLPLGKNIHARREAYCDEIVLRVAQVFQRAADEEQSRTTSRELSGRETRRREKREKEDVRKRM